MSTTTKSVTGVFLKVCRVVTSINDYVFLRLSYSSNNNIAKKQTVRKPNIFNFYGSSKILLHIRMMCLHNFQRYIQPKHLFGFRQF